MKFIKFVFLFAFISMFIGCIGGTQVSKIKMPDSAFLDGGSSKTGIILLHDDGGNPNSYVVVPLRNVLNSDLGYHTLSLQLPKWPAKLSEYKYHFHKTYDYIDEAVNYLVKEKKVERIFIIGHNLGATLASAYLEKYPQDVIKGFVGFAMRDGGGYPMDSANNLEGLKIPVLDVYGTGGDRVYSKDAEKRAKLVSDTYKQHIIPFASDKFTGYDFEITNAVIEWIITIKE